MNVAASVTVLRPGTDPARDTVAEEVPVAFEYNGISHAVMLATPADLRDLALGFSLSEGIVSRRQEIFDVEEETSPHGITLKIDIAGERFQQLKFRRRVLAGRTGCGLCGTESLSEVVRELPPVLAGPALSLELLYRGMSALPPLQALQQLTGATHAAAVLDAEGQLYHVREDVGRHNALDKSLGAFAATGKAPAGALLVTSRASFEMVQKAGALGFPVLAAVSAPTAAAVRLADKLAIGLVGFLRDRRCVVYTHPERLQGIAQ